METRVQPKGRWDTGSQGRFGRQTFNFVKVKSGRAVHTLTHPFASRTESCFTLPLALQQEERSSHQHAPNLGKLS